MRAFVEGGGKKISEKSVLNLLSTETPKALFDAANAVRKECVGDGICVYALINFSNYCRNNCLYCGMRRDNLSLTRYRMKPGEIIDAAKEACEMGYKMITLMSGEDIGYSTNSLERVVREIARECDALIFVSIGNRGRSVYERLKSAGAAGAQMRFETSSPSLFAKLKPGENFADRVNAIKLLKKLGYYLCTGFMVGLPGQSLGEIARDLIFTNAFNAQMVSTNPYVCCPQTPLAGNKNGDKELGYRVVAVSRLLCPKAMIPITIAHETLDSNAKKIGFQAGANMLMVNATPRKYVSGFALYPNMYGADRSVDYLTKEVFSSIRALGRKTLGLDELTSLFDAAG